MGVQNSYEGMTLKELKRLPKVRTFNGWHEMKKGEILARLQTESDLPKSGGSKSKAASSEEKKPVSKKSGKKQETNSEVQSKASAGKKSASLTKKSPSEKVAAGKKSAKPPVISSEQKKPAAGSKSLSAKPMKKQAEIEEKPSAQKTPAEKSLAEKLPPQKSPAGPLSAEKYPAEKQSAEKQQAEKLSVPLSLAEENKLKFSNEIPAASSRLSVFPNAESERIGRTPGSKEKGAKPVVDYKKNPELMQETGQTEEDRQRANTLRQKMNLRKTLETPVIDGRPVEDRLLLSVCGPFWLHACWEISGTLINRIRAAMGYLWHTADPVLRLYRITTNMAGLIHREYLSDIPISGGVYNWYINVDDPPNSFLVEIGYKARDGKFFSLVSSNIVETPQNYLQDGAGYGMPLLSQSYPHVPMAAMAGGEIPAKPPLGRFGQVIDIQVDAELVIKGQTSPDVQLTIKGERVWLQSDGSFLIRYHLPERRHVFPIVALSRDGMETKTVVLAVERNTKNLETVIRDTSEEE